MLQFFDCTQNIGVGLLRGLDDTKGGSRVTRGTEAAGHRQGGSRAVPAGRLRRRHGRHRRRGGRVQGTVDNHFGSKEALFTAVITSALDEPLGHASSVALVGLPEAEDLRSALIDAARTWVHAAGTNQDVIALRDLVAAEQHRIPELGRAWHGHGPEGHHPAVAGALRALADQGRLVIPDLEVAIVQLHALLVFPHMVFSTYGTHMDDSLTERLIVSGVDMFLGYYGPGRDR